MQQQNEQHPDACWSANEIRLSNTLRRLWFEHVMWTRAFIKSVAYGSKDLDAVTNRLLRNPTDFARVLAPLYGEPAAMRFESLFRDHLLIAAKLVSAAKAGDTKTVDEQRRKWVANADDIAAFLSDANPYWNKQKWQAMLYDHLKMTENEAVQLLMGNYAQSIDQFDAIQQQALMMANDMTRGIIRQFRV